MRTSRIVFASSLLAITFYGASASATSLEVDVRPAFGEGGGTSPVVTKGTNVQPNDTIFSGTSSPYGIGFDGDASIGIKIIPFLSIGLMGQFRNMSATAPKDASGITSPSRSAWGAGPYVHGYLDLPFIPVVPWAGIGVAYLQDTQTYSIPFTAANATNVPTTVTMIHYGVSVPITVGVIYPFLHFFGVGPSFTYAPTFGVAGCYGFAPTGYASQNLCSNGTSGKDTVSATQYGTWTLGLDVRFTVP